MTSHLTCRLIADTVVEVAEESRRRAAPRLVKVFCTIEGMESLLYGIEQMDVDMVNLGINVYVCETLSEAMQLAHGAASTGAHTIATDGDYIRRFQLGDAEEFVRIV